MERQGGDPQPVEVALASLPKGWTSEKKIAIPADQNRAVFELTLPFDNQDSEGLVHVEVTSTYHGQPLKFKQVLSPLPVARMPQKVEVYPKEVELVGKSSARQLVVTGYDGNQTPQDWTRDAVFSCLDETIAEVRTSRSCQIGRRNESCSSEMHQIKSPSGVCTSLAVT